MSGARFQETDQKFQEVEIRNDGRFAAREW
jgi:hypothetical protein